MADEILVRRQLESAGYQVISFERIDAPVNMGATVDEAIAFQLGIDPTGELYREAGV